MRTIANELPSAEGVAMNKAWLSAARSPAGPSGLRGASVVGLTS